MTQDDILRIAHEAGIDFQSHTGALGLKNVITCGSTPIEKIKRFAALVAAAEREACLQIADYCADADMHASMAANAIRARGNQ